MNTDEEIKVDITKQLQWDARIDASDVAVKVDNGDVVLNGEVPSITAKTAASDDAFLVEGVISVENNLEVDFPESKAVPSDTDIKSNIVAGFSFNSDLESYKIEVDVDDGWVTLEGTVNAFWEKLEAEDEARNVNGVIGVSNNLAVVPTGDFLDEDIAEDIVRALERNVHVNSDNINVKVENGNVTLTGRVKTVKARNAAYNSALYTAGVISVTNNITVG